MMGHRDRQLNQASAAALRVWTRRSDAARLPKIYHTFEVGVLAQVRASFALPGPAGTTKSNVSWPAPHSTTDLSDGEYRQIIKEIKGQLQDLDSRTRTLHTQLAPSNAGIIDLV